MSLQRYSCNREHAGVIAQTSGALRYLVYILQLNYLSENDQSKAAAAYALQNLAYHSSATRERIAQAGAIPVLVQLLQSPDDTVREAGAGKPSVNSFFGGGSYTALAVTAPIAVSVRSSCHCAVERGSLLGWCGRPLHA